MRPLFFFLAILLIGFGFRPAVASAQPAEATAAKEALYYTIQIGSFGNEAEAIACYKRLDNQLSPELKQFLRVEVIPPFHTVRIGKADSRQPIEQLLAKVEKISQRPPTVVHGYFRPQRIVKLYDSTGPSEAAQSPPPPSPKKTPPLPVPAEEPLSSKPDTKVPPRSESQEEPLDSSADTKAAPKAKPARRTESPKKPARPAAPAKIPDATLKQMILDKYLAHQSANQKNKEALIKQAQSFPESPACLTAECHGPLASGKSSHYPTQSGRCQACHKQINQKHPDANVSDFQLVAKDTELCNTCHPKLQGKKYSHPPAAKGECLKCHSPHASDNQFLLNAQANSQTKLCQTCHDQQIGKSKFTHGPVGLGACSFCHAPHESDYQALLKEEPNTQCLECHVDIAKGLAASTSVHQIVQTGGCASCHLPHGSDFPSLLKQDGEHFCFSCHQTVEEKYNKSRSKHAGVYLEKQCGTCHQPHYSPYPKLLNTKEMDLCLSCHSEKSSIRSKSPKDIAKELEKTFLHEPITKGECSVCHDPHGSKYLQLLAGPYPDTFYAQYEPGMYDLCFICHDQELLTNETTATATSFRNGKQNLHYLHSTIPRKGRTCQTCHQAHSSDGPKLINQTGSAFGEWQMSISFSTTSNGGSCMPGCHRKMEYNRDKEVNNSGKDLEFGEYHVEYQSIK